MARGIYVQPVGRLPRELFRVKPPEFVGVQMWTPDGRDVLFMRYSVGQDAAVNPHQLWTIDTAGVRRVARAARSHA